MNIIQNFKKNLNPPKFLKLSNYPFTPSQMPKFPKTKKQNLPPQNNPSQANLSNTAPNFSPFQLRKNGN